MPKFEDVNLVALLVAIIGAGGFGVFGREIVNIVTLLRSGVSARENRRKKDLVGQRDAALDRAALAERRADQEAAARRLLQEYSSRCRRLLIEHGLERVIPRWPKQLRDFESIPDETGPIEIVAAGAGPFPADTSE